MRIRRQFLLAGLTLAFFGCARHGGPLELSGNLETDDHDLVAPTTAQILSIRVTEGQTVALGDTVAILDTVTAAAAYRAAQAAEAEAQAHVADLEFGSDREKIRAAHAQVGIAEDNLAQAERDVKRVDSLFALNLTDAQTKEHTTVARDNAAGSLQYAREQLADLVRGARVHQLEGAYAALDGAKATRAARQRDFERLILTATSAGIIQFLPYQVGEYAATGRAVATINDPSDIWVKVYVPEARLGEVKIGQKVRLTVDAIPSKNYDGSVVFIASDAEFTPRNVQTPDERLNLVFAVKVAVTPGQDGLRPGMPADVHFQ